MGERFPNVDWWCDRCNAYLNGQSGFDDHKYIWECTECGIKVVFQVLTYTSLKMITEIKINEVELFQVKSDKLAEFETFNANVAETQKNNRMK